MKESEFQARLIKTIKKTFPGAIVLKNDPNYIQGFPDLTILWRDRWAVLEVKRAEFEKHQPNQDYYIDQLDEMSYAAFIYPENEEQILDEIQRAFNSGRTARLSFG